MPPGTNYRILGSEVDEWCDPGARARARATVASAVRSRVLVVESLAGRPGVPCASAVGVRAGESDPPLPPRLCPRPKRGDGPLARLRVSCDPKPEAVRMRGGIVCLRVYAPESSGLKFKDTWIDGDLPPILIHIAPSCILSVLGLVGHGEK